MSGTSHNAKRFLMAIAVAVAVAVTYVATATGSGVQARSTASQLAALKKDVATLSKKVKTAQNDVNAVALVYMHCSLHSQIGIDQRGGAAFGYSYSPDGINSGFTTALDLNTAGTPTYVITPFNSTDAACESLIGAAARHRDTSSVFAQRFAQKP
jgi:hypothetical protein